MSELTKKLRSYHPTSGYSTVMRKAADEIDQLRAEVERLHGLVEIKFSNPACVLCGNLLTEVRPGKHQCDYCELEREVERLTEEVKQLKYQYEP